MEQRTRKKSRLTTLREHHTEEIILNYGIEIESVFELINEYIAYNQFINFYLNYINKRFDTNPTIHSFIKILNTCISNYDRITDIDNINDDIIILEQNDIYKKLTPTKTVSIIRKKEKKSKGKKEEYDFLSGLGSFSSSSSSSSSSSNKEEIKEIDNLLTIELKKLITNKRLKETDISEETKELIKKWYEFLNIGIKIIKYMLDKSGSPYNIRDVIETLLNIPEEIINNVFIVFKNIFDLTTNGKIKLFDITEDEDINNFYKTIAKEDEIILCLTEDLSVLCDRTKVYKDIISGEIVKYNRLLNKCEFITQPFKTIEEIKTKLPIFFEEPIIKNTLLNCVKTSQHVHISFNNRNGIIKPDIYIILSIVCVCLYYQDEIFKLFLITRTDNIYCKKLIYNENLMTMIYDISQNNYGKNIMNISSIFFEKHVEFEYYYYNRYYWLNILNLYKINDDINDKPYTIEFRLKHGSTDAEELGNVCKLYENIINYAKELLTYSFLKEKRNIKDFKIAIEEIMSDNKERTFNEKILKGIYYYFKDPNSKYVKGLKKLNRILGSGEPESDEEDIIASVSGGRKSSRLRSKLDNIGTIIKYFKEKPLYRMNSFGIEYIGNGLNEEIINSLREKFKSNGNIKNEELKKYLKLNNILYN